MTFIYHHPPPIPNIRNFLQEFHWNEVPTKENFLKYNFNVNDGEIKIEWMKDGKLNICYNALDRHIEKRGSQVRCNSDGPGSDPGRKSS